MRSKRKSNALPSNSLQLNVFPTAECETFTFCCASIRSDYDADVLRLTSILFCMYDVTHCTVNSINSAPHST